MEGLEDLECICKHCKDCPLYVASEDDCDITEEQMLVADTVSRYLDAEHPEANDVDREVIMSTAIRDGITIDQVPSYVEDYADR